MIVITATSVGVTAVGVLVVYKTLEETTELRIQAQRTTQAALATVDVTREIGEKQIRAYLTVRNLKTEKFTVGKPVSVAAEIENAGQSPALNVSVIAILHTHITEHPKKYPLSPTQKYRHPNWRSLQGIRSKLCSAPTCLFGVIGLIDMLMGRLSIFSLPLFLTPTFSGENGNPLQRHNERGIRPLLGAIFPSLRKRQPRNIAPRTPNPRPHLSPSGPNSRWAPA